MRLDDELHVRLPEVPSAGYRWQVNILDAADAGLSCSPTSSSPTYSRRSGWVSAADVTYGGRPSGPARGPSISDSFDRGKARR